MELILMRHAQSEHNVGLSKSLDSKLTNLGLQQAYETVLNLSARFDLSDFRFISSPMYRTMQTAHFVSELVKKPFMVHEGARECLLKDYPGSENGVILTYHHHEFKWDHHERGDGLEKHHPAETYEEFMNRIKAFLDSLDKNGKYFIVSHASPIQAMFGWATSGGTLDIMDQIVIDNIRCHWGGVKNCSITHVKDCESLTFAEVFYNQDHHEVLARI